MNEIQRKILEVSFSQDLSKMSLREIGSYVGESHPQKIKYHIQRLEKLGYLNLKGNSSPLKNLRKSQSINSKSEFVSIKIIGEANCGEATLIAEERDLGSIIIPISQVGKKRNLFSVIARGRSMDQAQINGKNIQDGDFLIIDPNPTKFKSGKDYVLSTINGMANVKKFFLDYENEQVVLLSESSDTRHQSPIFIPSDRLNEYLINGLVIDVVKKPNLKIDLFS
jgi:repressor LexA